ncbi:MAG: dihydrofolate reductase [Anaerovoracaceae bacterium]|jgi:dihydrofolate reductase|nr:dihydrofolate reductase [Anaerovoracaceae bacterium]
MKAIVAVDKNWAIGNCGKLLCNLPGDLQYFKEKTKGKVVLMGRKTFESLPGKKPLPDRINTVLSLDPSFQAPCLVCHTDKALKRELANYNMDDIFVIGGETIYRQLLPLCDTVFVTKIDAVFEADSHFPNLDQDPNYELVWTSKARNEGGIGYKFTEYKKVENENQE